MAFVRLAFFSGASRRHFDALSERLGDAPVSPERLLFASGPLVDRHGD